jgi:hypothetical protein
MQGANTWKYTCNNIEQSINQNLREEIKIIHEETQFVQNTNINTKTPGEDKNYPRIMTTTDMYFTQEIKLLSKGFRYSLRFKEKIG